MFGGIFARGFSAGLVLLSGSPPPALRSCSQGAEGDVAWSDLSLRARGGLLVFTGPGSLDRFRLTPPPPFSDLCAPKAGFSSACVDLALYSSGPFSHQGLCVSVVFGIWRVVERPPASRARISACSQGASFHCWAVGLMVKPKSKKKGTGQVHAIAPAVHPWWAGDSNTLVGPVHPGGFLGLGATLSDQVAAQKRVADGESPEDVYLQHAPDSSRFAKSLSFSVEVRPVAGDYVDEALWIDVGVSLPLLFIIPFMCLCC